MKIKLPIYRRGGELVRAYQVEQVTLEAESAVQVSAQLAHHVILIDRSGSMKELMPELQHQLNKLLVLEEFKDAQVKVSLLSYASQGDLTVHCERAPLAELMSRGDERLTGLRELEAQGKTCISQALERALSLCVEGELTAISLHSDGYANDPRYTRERAALIELAQRCHSDTRGAVTLNTIAHSIDSDCALLSELAELGGGRCLIARDSGEVFQGLHHTTELLAQPEASAYSVPHQGPWVMFSRKDKVIKVGVGAQEVSGFGASSPRTLITYSPLEVTSYEELELPAVAPMSPKGRELCVALSRAALSYGDLNECKWALLSSGSAPLIHAHLNATSAFELGLLGHELEGALFGFELATHPQLDLSALPPLPSVIEVMSLIHERRDQVRVDREHLKRVYQSRGPLSPSEVTGEQVPLELEYHARPIEGSDVHWHALRLSHQTATLNLVVRFDVELISAEGEVVSELEGIPINPLQSFRSYSVIVNGALHLPRLRLYLESESLHQALRSLGLISGPYEPKRAYELSLEGLPVISEEALQSIYSLGTPEEARTTLDGLFERVAQARFLSSASRAILKARADRFSEEQLLGLKRIGINPSQDVNEPMTYSTPTGVSSPEIERTPQRATRPHYVVELGEGDQASVKRLPSANSFFQSQYYVIRAGEPLEKPTLQDLLSGLEVRDKQLSQGSSRRRLLKPLMDGLLGRVEGLEALSAALEQLELPSELRGQLLEHSAEGAWGEVESVELFSKLKGACEQRIEQLYLTHICPLVMMIGSLGMTPRALRSCLVSPAMLRERHPKLRFTEQEEAGLCLLAGERAFLTITVEERA